MKIFITGITSGIGRVASNRLLQAGHQVWGTTRDASRVPPAPGLHPITLDLNDLASIRSGFERASADSGGFDVLINNAGEVVNAPFEQLAADGLRQQFETFFFGPAELIRLALPGMRARRSGLIINITSLAVQFPIPFNAGYNCAKAALAAASEGLRLELLGTGVRVVDLQPGDVKTEILRRTRNMDTAVSAAYEPNLSRARTAESTKEAAAIDAERVAALILKLLVTASPPPRMVIGNTFEQWIAPLGARLLPRRAIEWGQRLTYDLRASRS
ncbi:MAG: SDR family NAD(P)-dependent oxidoreductase [Vicinamibacterales bacterium]